MNLSLIIFFVCFVSSFSSSSSSFPYDPSCPNCPPVPVIGALPFFTVTQDGFSVENSTRYHNRPLYGNHNSALILSGDRPITHLANDTVLFGGFLFGISRGSIALWAHNADTITSTFSPKIGAVVWTIKDTSLPGIIINAMVMSTSTDVGMIFDINITDTSNIGTRAEFIWAYGCSTDRQSGGQRIGWQKDPLINTDVLQWTFSPNDCNNNKVLLNPSNTSFEIEFGSSTIGVLVATNALSTSLTLQDSSLWTNISSYSNSNRKSSTSETNNNKEQIPLPVTGASLWLNAHSLVSILTNNSRVTSWKDDSDGSNAILIQNESLKQPLFISDGLGNENEPGIRFDGETTFLESTIPYVGSESTMFAVFKDEGTTCDCCSGVLFFTNSFNGISTLPAKGAVDDDDNNHGQDSPIVTTLDFPGSAAYGHTNIRNKVVVASSVYTSTGPSTSFVDNCLQYSSPVSGTSGSGGVQVGTRNNELQRFFKGVIGEIVVFNRLLTEIETSEMYTYFASVWPSMPKKQCVKEAPLAVGKSLLVDSTTESTRFSFLIARDIVDKDPLHELILSYQRATELTSTAATTPEPLVNSALASMGLAVDGLFRNNPGGFVHGAMAWDTLYVGWRSEYGATVFGQSNLVAQEGILFISMQITNTSENTNCVTSPSLRHTQEDKSSRFYGLGHIGDPNNGNQAFYDMQTQFFDQQLHMIRWTGNTTHEALLFNALKLHVQWAQDSFDSDGNGLFSSYINTWPTDSQFYNGGETYEETSYIYLAAIGLKDMAIRAGNLSEAAIYLTLAQKIQDALPQLWVQQSGHPSSHREETGLQRLRPDPWLYSIFLPIEASLFTQEEAAQALYFTEWGLERNSIYCNSFSSDICGETVWTSNWLPAQWSIRQLWSGDISALVFAYFLSGLPDDGYTVLLGNLHRDMLQSAVPGMTGGANGGTDFNDCVHPLSRTLVSGLFGYLPDYLTTDVIGGIVTISPQFPISWNTASLTSHDVTITFSMSQDTITINASITKPSGQIRLKIPVPASKIISIVPNSYAPLTAKFEYEILAGFGQSIVLATLTSLTISDLVSELSVTVIVDSILSRQSSIQITSIEGEQITLSSSDVIFTNYSDPQGIFLPNSVNIINGNIIGTLSEESVGYHLIFGYGNTKDGAPQIILFKLNITSSTSLSNPLVPSLSILNSVNWWSYVPLDIVLNADLGNIYKPGTYLTPRPETCAVRIGDDGWSAWTFPYWGNEPPILDFSNVANLTIPGNQGIIKTSQGAQFFFNKTIGMNNIAFVSRWDVYPTFIKITIPPVTNAQGVWILLAGSTNPMQTKFSNAALVFSFSDGSSTILNLIPPMNYWALSGWGSADYNYDTDSFILPTIPPPTCQLGKNNRAMVYYQTIKPNTTLVQVSLEALSLEIVVGILGISLIG
jgi:hypothetical protein